MEVTDLSWCEKHAGFLEEHDISPQDIVQALLRSIAAQGAAMRGYQTPEDLELAAKAITRMAGDQPFCCKLGDEKLRAIVSKALTERMSQPE